MNHLYVFHSTVLIYVGKLLYVFHFTVQWNVSYQPSEHVGQLNNLPIYCFLINAHISWRQLHEKTALHVCILPHSIVGGLAFQVLLFCLFFICDRACAVVLRMLSVTPQNKSIVCWIFRRNLLSLKEWLELLMDLSRVWDWKVDCVRHHQVGRQAENISKSSAEQGLYEEMLHHQDGVIDSHLYVWKSTQYEYDKHVACQASDLRNIQNYGQGSVPTCLDNWNYSTVLVYVGKLESDVDCTICCCMVTPICP